MTKYVPTCHCGEREGYTTVLNNHAFVGITTKLRKNGVFIGNMALALENNFCPQCGAPRKLVEIDRSDTP